MKVLLKTRPHRFTTLDHKIQIPTPNGILMPESSCQKDNTLNIIFLHTFYDMQPLNLRLRLFVYINRISSRTYSSLSV